MKATLSVMSKVTTSLYEITADNFWVVVYDKARKKFNNQKPIEKLKKNRYLFMLFYLCTIRYLINRDSRMTSLLEEDQNFDFLYRKKVS